MLSTYLNLRIFIISTWFIHNINFQSQLEVGIIDSFKKLGRLGLYFASNGSNV